MLSGAARGKLCSPSGRISTRDGWSPLPCLGVRACVRVRVRAGAEKGSSRLTVVAWVAYLLGDGPVIGKFTIFFSIYGASVALVTSGDEDGEIVIRLPHYV